MKRLKSKVIHADRRGIFMEICRDNRWQALNYFTCKAGCSRGNHYHKKTRELFFIIAGVCRVTVRNLKTGKQQSFTARQHDIFIIDHYEVHSIDALKKIRAVTLLDKAHDENRPDLHPLPAGWAAKSQSR